jgi:hypothetical protein
VTTSSTSSTSIGLWISLAGPNEAPIVDESVAVVLEIDEEDIDGYEDDDEDKDEELGCWSSSLRAGEESGDRR